MKHLEAQQARRGDLPVDNVGSVRIRQQVVEIYVVAQSNVLTVDLAIERLVANASSCLSADGTGRFEPTSAVNCRPDNVAFKRLVNQLGFALAEAFGIFSLLIALLLLFVL